MVTLSWDHRVAVALSHQVNFSRQPYLQLPHFLQIPLNLIWNQRLLTPHLLLSQLQTPKYIVLLNQYLSHVFDLCSPLQAYQCILLEFFTFTLFSVTILGVGLLIFIVSSTTALSAPSNILSLTTLISVTNWYVLSLRTNHTRFSLPGSLPRLIPFSIS